MYGELQEPVEVSDAKDYLVLGELVSHRTRARLTGSADAWAVRETPALFVEPMTRPAATGYLVVKTTALLTRHPSNR